MSKFTESTEKVISGNCSLALEEAQPEDLGVLNTEVFTDLFRQIIVHDVLEVHLVEVVSPWVQDREARMIDALCSVLNNVVANKIEVSFIGLNRVE